MHIHIEKNKEELGRKASTIGAEAIKKAISENGIANIIFATGASQFEMLHELSKETDINWSKVNGFHLDEYIGIPISHPASFRLYLWKRFISQLPTPINSFHFINTEEDPQEECEKIGKLISSLIIDVAFIGIGENAHVAFNDPPADFKINAPYIIVNLDDDCRNQQLGEGWFKTIEEVPKQAVSMSVTQIMKSQKIICSVPDERKANAIKNSLTPPVTPNYPASILNEHKDCHLFLDKQSSSLLNN